MVVLRKGRAPMKRDMRVTMPLWQMGGIILTIVLTVIMGKSTEVVSSGKGSLEFTFTLAGTSGFIFCITAILLFLYMILFLGRIYKHNRQYPNKRINAFSFKPKEGTEDNRLFDEITKRATKKVYSYYAWILPIFVGVALLTFWSRTMILLGILVVALGQYWIYYASIQDGLQKIEEDKKL